MPRVMTLGRLPLSGDYRPAPGRHLGRAGLGSLLDVCNDPATALLTATGAGVGAGLDQYGRTVTYGEGDSQTTGDVGYQAAGGALQAFSQSFAQQCATANAREAERQRLASQPDPVLVAQANAQAQIDAIRAQTVLVQQQQQQALAAQQSGYQQETKILGMTPQTLAIAAVGTVAAGALAVLLLR